MLYPNLLDMMFCASRGSEKLLLREVFASVQDSESLSRYIRTYVFVRFSSPCSHREIYGDLPYLLDVKVDELVFQAITQYWNSAYSCFTFGRVDLVPTVEEHTVLLRCPKIQVDKAYSMAPSVPTFVRKLINITGMNEQWVTARIKQKGEYKCISWKALKDLILVHPDMKKRIDVFALSIYGLVIFPKALGYVDEAVSDFF
ncbi:6-phosphofructo-2-kinase/fructose-2,6-bisphosphatase-like protein [Gossypium australe]|uniref:6-phosphofructo-2-kinase/fructose-2, 6-bisphosphatase-like protein n=1 Tax=Gossypium australe TaxID=47621 RepID=A0A5B6V7L7_9ROSI|nr:6-phosphofructo-2-kinase/fructose-2,6-bisphosphatase-like protein [Gossypium australe]